MSDKGQLCSRLRGEIFSLPQIHLFLSLPGFGEPRLGHNLQKGLGKLPLAQSRHFYSKQKELLRINYDLAHSPGD